ncbi:MAG: dATP/dGTP diphosphohydrolase domain-containing protein [Gemmobacter sp.]
MTTAQTMIHQQDGFGSSAAGAKREKLHALPYDLVPFQEITEAYARVAEIGARKYAPWNWSLGLSRVQLLGSLLRHAFAYIRGEERDKESGLCHADHILWNAVALVHNVHWNLEDGRRGEPERFYKGRRTTMTAGDDHSQPRELAPVDVVDV